MNTNKIKKYAPKARKQFIEAVTKRANIFGIYSDTNITEPVITDGVMQIDGNSFNAAMANSRAQLVTQVKQQGFDSFIEQIAYTWFNRFSAIRFMELKENYLEHGLRVLSHPADKEGEGNRLEILEHAQEVANDLGLNRERIIELKLAGNKDEELYRKLLIGQCHQLHDAMPFLFEKLDDKTELLLPDNLIRTDSILRSLVNDIPEEDWQQVEVIGWLYQFYISEKKDEVIGKVVKSEDIPAATQLFTPNWIVKYLVQNSVGRQWLQTYPDSSIKTQMEYYIEPAEQSDEVNAQLKAITPDSIEPESIKVLDPACGSGHILVEAYQVLKAIYEERGYRSRDIPQLILQNNLFGLDIDDRAAQLSGFALMMMARADDRRIFSRDITLNVLSIQESCTLDLELIWRELGIKDSELYTMVEDIWIRFEQGKTFGSLVDIPDRYEQKLKNFLTTLNEIISGLDSFQKKSAIILKPIIYQASLLAQRYDAVVANPPYMGGKGMNAELKKFAKDNYPNSKSDMFAIFMEHGFSLLKEFGFNAQINMQSWMFLSSYENLREWLLDTKTFVTMAHLGARAFNQISGEVVQTTAWVLNKKYIDCYQPIFFRLIEGNEYEKQQALLKQGNRFNNTLQNDFKKIPGSPIAYWLSENAISTFGLGASLGTYAEAKSGMSSCNSERFLRQWFEVSISKISSNSISHKKAELSQKKWFPYNKGGGGRRWYGYNDVVINWSNSGVELKQFVVNNPKDPNTTHWSRRLFNLDCFFKVGLTWSAISSANFSCRTVPNGVIPGTGSKTLYDINESISKKIMAFLNSSVSLFYLKLFAPTLNFEAGDVGKLEVLNTSGFNQVVIDKLVCISQSDWDSSEVSWNFPQNFLLNDKHDSDDKLDVIYSSYVNKNKQIIVDVQKLEEKNNRFFIEAYGLKDELTSEVPIEQVTLNINPKYRYGRKGTDEESVNRFQSDSLAEMISYSIGCMMGRYSLDRVGLIYAHSGNEDFTNLVEEGAYTTFTADDDGIIPLTDQDWFADDATNRFREFVRVVWGEEHLQENIDFVAESLCLYAIKAKRGETSLEIIRRYLSNQFYKDHLKKYKKRPIYWLFSSGKQKAFECLVYLHRYNEGTLARMRTEYVTPLLGKYDAYSVQLTKQVDDASSTTEASRLKKEQAALQKKQNELREFDDKLKHYADMQISLDLDDGVKVNYGKFGDLLADVKVVTGSAPKVK